jgi:hypothetical protein
MWRPSSNSLYVRGDIVAQKSIDPLSAGFNVATITTHAARPGLRDLRTENAHIRYFEQQTMRHVAGKIPICTVFVVAAAACHLECLT